MNTITTSAQTTTLRTLLTSLAFSIALVVSGTAAAQTSAGKTLNFTDNQAYHTQTTDELKVGVFPIPNTLIMKVVLENPAKERVTVLIKDSNDEIVYRKMVGSHSIIHSKFDVSKLINGNYTMVIESANQLFSNAFYLQTLGERIARAF